MPARSTPFQKLVVHLQTQLAPGCEVKESAFLKHRGTGKGREVDVLIRSTVGEHTVLVSIEAIEHRRPADDTWVEKMLMKHKRLETNKLVLVSLSGFSKDARDLARSEGVETYTPDDACKLDWTRVVGSTHVTLARFDVVAPYFEVGLDGAARIEAAGNSVISDRGGSRVGTLAEMVTQTLMSEDPECQRDVRQLPPRNICSKGRRMVMSLAETHQRSSHRVEGERRSWRRTGDLAEAHAA